MAQTALQKKFHRYWRCEVFTSGFHNGCRCRPDDPHDGWDCQWVWTATLPDNGHTRRLLGESVPAPSDEPNEYSE